MQIVTNAYFDLVQRIKHVEFGQRHRTETINLSRVTRGECIEPAASPRSSRGSAIFTAAFAISWPISASASNISVGNGPSPTRVVYVRTIPSTPVMRCGARTCADARAADSGAGRSYEWISAVIDIEQSGLRAFEQNRATRRSGLIEKMTGVADERRETFDHRRCLVENRIDVQRLAAVSHDDAIGVFEVSLNS
jgi:hypothetical protein